MTQRIKVADLLEFDAAPYLDSEAAIAAYLTDILDANDPALLAAALGVRLVAQATGLGMSIRPPAPSQNRRFSGAL